MTFGGFNYSTPSIFQSKCLTVLHLTRCRVHYHLFNGEANFASVQEVVFDSVCLAGETLSKFTSKCPNIKELRLLNCQSITFIVLPKLDRLKKLYVKFLDSYSSITDVQVVAPSLQVFHFMKYNHNKVPVNMDIRACRMLREFLLGCNFFPVCFDHEHFVSDFPQLESYPWPL